MITISTNNVNSKLLLVSSLKELMYSKAFSKISVDEIVENCNLSRQTFYKYFYDKYDLLSFVYETDTEHIFKQYNANKDFVEFTSSFMEYFRDNKIYMKLLFDIDCPNLFSNFWYKFSITFMIKEIGEKRITTELMVAIYHFCYGSYFVIHKWLLHDLKEPREEIAYYIVKSMPDILKPYLQISI